MPVTVYNWRVYDIKVQMLYKEYDKNRDDCREEYHESH